MVKFYCKRFHYYTNKGDIMLEKLEWLDDPRVFRVGKLPTHSDHTMYRTTD